MTPCTVGIQRVYRMHSRNGRNKSHPARCFLAFFIFSIVTTPFCSLPHAQVPEVRLPCLCAAHSPCGGMFPVPTGVRKDRQARPEWPNLPFCVKFRKSVFPLSGVSLCNAFPMHQFSLSR